MSSGLATRETIDSYVQRLDIKGGKIDREAFRQFIRLLDVVLVGEDGEMLQ